MALKAPTTWSPDLTAYTWPTHLLFPKYALSLPPCLCSFRSLLLHFTFHQSKAYLSFSAQFTSYLHHEGFSRPELASEIVQEPTWLRGATVAEGTDFRTFLSLQNILLDSAALAPHPYRPPPKSYLVPPPPPYSQSTL